MKWTKEQQEAIDKRDTNLLVAAAAGSGKTAVLVERIKKLILEEGVSLDRMLIVTFTNAAAAEMKEKIRKALKKEIENDREHSKELRDQLALLPRANISTFHAFALEVIRRFFFMTDADPGFKICDDAKRAILREEAMDQLLEEEFEAERPDFYQFLDWYSSDRNENKIREIIDDSYNRLMSMPYPWQWFDEKLRDLSCTPEEFSDSGLMEYMTKYIAAKAEESMKYARKAHDILAESALDRLAEKLLADIGKINDMITAINAGNFAAAGVLITSVKWERLTAKKDEKEDYEAVKPLLEACRKKSKDIIKDIGETFYSQSAEEMTEEFNKTKPLAETLLRLLKRFDGIFKKAKNEKKLVDFNDIEHLCLSILQEKDPSEYYRKRFRYIFIDEYQDTNVLQEEIISKIKRENNLFMVGDIKQSIYKFRLAEPEIFKEKYEKYSSGDPDSAKIDLNRNFRSKMPVIDAINRIFVNIMEDYDDAAKLYAGIGYSGEYLYKPVLDVIDTSTADLIDDEEIASLKSAEIEANHIANVIERYIGKKYFDAKTEEVKELEARDIVILMRGVKTTASTYTRVLKEHGIDSFVDDNDGYFDTIEINVFMNLLSVIDNRYQDVPLISVLHSEIFGFSADELAEIRLGTRKGSYAGAFAAYGENGVNEELRAKCKEAAEKILSWKQASVSLPLGQFVWKLLLETGYYMDMGAMPGGSQRQANLRALVDRAESFSEDNQTSLYSFVRYIDAVKMRKVTMGQVKLVGENDNIVRIMTIHKSKGLEFPMVILAGLGRKLNYSKVGSGVSIHKDIGIGMSLVNREERWYKKTLIQNLIAKHLHKEEFEEEIRILYVALTRAKDILYMTGTVPDIEKYIKDRESGAAGDTSYLKIMGDSYPFREISAAQIFETEDEEKEQEKGENFDREVTSEEAADVLRKLSYVYPFENASSLKSKYSATEINKLEGPEVYRAPVLATPKFRQGEKKLTPAERGTVYHGIMERLNFDRAEKEGLSYIEAAAKRYVSEGIFDEMEISAVDLTKIDNFFRTDLGRRFTQGYRENRIERERPFELLMEMNGEDVIVQGIIDCYMEEENSVVLMDYKSAYIRKSVPLEEEEERLRETYRGQMEVYRKAIEASLGKEVSEIYLYVFDPGVKIKM